MSTHTHDTFLKPDPFTPEELRECYLDKRMSQREIAKQFHCDVKRVRAAMKREGITWEDKVEAKLKLHANQPKPQKKTKGPKYPFTRDELYNLYVEQKMSTRDIGEKVGVTRTVVSRYLRTFGIPARGPKLPAHRTEKHHYMAALNAIYGAYRTSASIRNYRFELTIEQFESLVINPCFYCGCPHSQKKGKYFFNGVDRSDNTLGYVIGNVRPCCTTCNIAKSTMPEEKFIMWILQAAKHLKANLLNDQEVAE